MDKEDALEGRRLIARLEITGEGINISHKDIPLNEFGESKCRFSEEGDIERFSFSAHALDGALLDFECHTWDEQGRHLEIFSGEDLKAGEGTEKEVEVDLPKGKRVLKVLFSLS